MSSFRYFCLSSIRSHLLTAMTEGAALLGHEIADGEILMLERALGVDEQDDDLGKANGAKGIAGRKASRRCR